MKKNNLIFILLLIFFLFISCDENDSNPTSPTPNNESVLDYYPLEVGNLWIYELYEADSSLDFISRNRFDSVYIKNDTIINGVNYKERYSTMFHKTTLLRDSSEYIINSNGNKLFTTNKNKELLYRQFYLNDSSFVFEWGVDKIDSTCTIPLGEYSAKYIKGVLKTYNADDKNYGERKLFTAYSKDIGPILIRQSFVHANIYLERRLIKYRKN